MTIHRPFTEAARTALLEAAAEIERELICCDVYERDKGTERAGREHAICFWAGAVRAIVLDGVEPAAVAVEGPPVVACLEGFHWIGQGVDACDQCGLPRRAHAGYATLRPGAGPFGTKDDWVLTPWPTADSERTATDRTNPGVHPS